MESEVKKLVLVENRDAFQLVPSWEVEWWWYLVGGVVLVLIGVGVFLLLRKGKSVDPERAKREAYRRAVLDLKGLKELSGREVAVEVSVILRRYLAESLGEPALYETHEEFVSRHGALGFFAEGLKGDVGRYFSELAAMKYGPVEVGGDVSVDLSGRGMNLLERMYVA